MHSFVFVLFFTFAISTYAQMLDYASENSRVEHISSGQCKLKVSFFKPGFSIETGMARNFSLFIGANIDYIAPLFLPRDGVAGFFDILYVCKVQSRFYLPETSVLKIVEGSYYALHSGYYHLVFNNTSFFLHGVVFGYKQHYRIYYWDISGGLGVYTNEFTGLSHLVNVAIGFYLN